MGGQVGWVHNGISPASGGNGDQIAPSRGDGPALGLDGCGLVIPSTLDLRNPGDGHIKMPQAPPDEWQPPDDMRETCTIISHNRHNQDHDPSPPHTESGPLTISSVRGSGNPASSIRSTHHLQQGIREPRLIKGSDGGRRRATGLVPNHHVMLATELVVGPVG